MPKTDGSDPLGWLFKAHEYFVFYGVAEDARLPAVSLMLEGPALDWFRWRQRNVLVSSWSDFVSQFKLRFDPLSYVDYFGLLSKSLFHAGLKSHLQHEIMLLKPGSLSASFALARELEVKYTAWTSAMPLRREGFRDQTASKTPNPPSNLPLLPSSGTKPPLATKSTADLPVRRLSYAERKERDAKGLCYNCDEKWVKGHSCGCFLLLFEDDIADDPGAPPDDMVLTVDVSSLHSLVTPRSLRLSGMINTVVVDVLIDRGSTHNFVHPSIIERAQLPVANVTPFRVYVGNGESLVCSRQSLQVPLLLQGFHFCVDVNILPIHGPDMVIGVQWLQLLGRVTHDYANLVMDFTWHGKPVTLRGDPLSPKPLSFHHFNSLCAARQVAECYELLISLSTAEASTTGEEWPADLPPEILRVLRQYPGVFAQPTGLPPRRLADHRIFLQFGTHPVNEGHSDDGQLCHLSQPLPAILQRIHAENTTRPDLQRMHGEYQRGVLQPPFSVINGVLYYNTRLCISGESDLRLELLKEYHASHTGGHTGVHRTFQRLAQSFYWPKMRADVRRFVASCQTCQTTKFSTQPPSGLLQPLPIPVQIWEDISMDFITGLPPSRGSSVIFVVVDRLSKYAHFGALPGDFDAHRTAFLFTDMVVKLHGIPKTIVSDRDKIFTSAFWKELHALSGTTLKHSTAFHPQTDGQTEVLNRTLEQYLRAFAHAKPKRWTVLLPWAKYSVKTSYHHGLQMTPFQAVYGRPPPELIPYSRGSARVQAVDDILGERDALLRRLRLNLELAQNRMKQMADGKRPYRLKLPDTSRIHPVFHVSVLRHFRDGGDSEQLLPLPAELVDGQAPSLPVKILDQRRVLQHGSPVDPYLVQWSDGGVADASWEPVETMQRNFPNLHLEDKVIPEGRESVMDSEQRAETQVRRSGRSAQVVPLQRRRWWSSQQRWVREFHVSSLWVQVPRHHPVSTTSAGLVISGSHRHVSRSSHCVGPVGDFGEKLVLNNFDALIPFLRLVSSNLDCLVLVDCCLSGTMTTLKFEVPLFDGRTDFMLWQCTIQDYLVQQGLDLALQDEKPSDMKESEWSTIQKKTVSTIRLALSPQIKVTVLKETSPKKLWEMLESKFASKTLTNRLMMRMDLYSLKMEEGGSVIDHINNFNEQVSRLLNAGEIIKDEEQELLLVASLPKSFKPFVQSMIAGRTTLRLHEWGPNIYEVWERSNRLSVVYIKTKIPSGIRGSIEKYDNVRELLKALDKHFETSDKALASTLIMKFSSAKLTGLRGVGDHINKMRDIAAQLKTLEVDMSETFLVHFILHTLPHQYGPFKISYNTHKDKWSINGLMAMCVQEEGRLVMEAGEFALVASHGKRYSHTKNKGKGKIPPQADIKKESKCFFCKKKGHIKKDCIKYKKWIEKKGIDKPTETSGT
ncbi:unnamed protein product [Cuscuta campestris]|uniref:Integrase catalytic domain-containing protein n=1 Tax=Cuscuta campestris TaxID=132261 RepID=A0A484LE23_9ASTE|nr:unnamed protein product [Cuscuta campestris]